MDQNFDLLRNSLFEVSNEWKVARKEVGNTSILVVDNALHRPSALRSFALSLDYDLLPAEREFKSYPGERALVCWRPNGLVEKIQTLAAQFDLISANTLFRNPAAFFTRMNHEKYKSIHPKQKVPHVDSGQSLVCVLHLSTDHNLGETAFYRHRRTGIQRLPSHPERNISDHMLKDGFDPLVNGDYLSYIKFLMYENLDEAAFLSGTGFPDSTKTWEVITKVRGCFNRLLIFPGEIFHSPIHTPLTSCGVSRLTLNLAFLPM